MIVENEIPHSRATRVAGTAEAVLEVLASGQHAGGAVRRRFEADLARRVGVPHGVAVQSGTAALHLALLCLGVGRGDRVLIPSYVCASLLHSIDAVGARPVVADVEERFFNLSPETARAALLRQGLNEGDVACAIVPHCFGFPAPLDRWDLSVPVIEDCAMALGASLRTRQAAGWGEISIFSFYATKMISTGQGGMVMTRNEGHASEAQDLIRHDKRERWRPCWNYLMPDLAAALGRVQLAHFDEFIEARARIAARYLDLTQELGVPCQESYPETTPNYYRFTLLVEERDRLMHHLAALGIAAQSPVYKPLHRYLNLDPTAFPGTESIQRRALSIPIYPSLSEEELERVITGVRSGMDRLSREE